MTTCPLDHNPKVVSNICLSWRVNVDKCVSPSVCLSPSLLPRVDSIFLEGMSSILSLEGIKVQNLQPQNEESSSRAWPGKNGLGDLVNAWLGIALFQHNTHWALAGLKRLPRSYKVCWNTKACRLLRLFCTNSPTLPALPNSGTPGIRSQAVIRTRHSNCLQGHSLQVLTTSI